MDIQEQLQESELLARVVARDQQAFEALYDRYAPVVYGLCYKILSSQPDAEEVVLDAFNQVWRSAEQYSPRRGRVDTWLFWIARSRALDRLRQRQRTDRHVEAGEAALAAAEPLVEIQGPETSVLIAERRREVLDALGQLPEVQRVALELAYYKGMSHSEIAEATGETLGTVKSRVRGGLGKLRTALAPWWDQA